MGVKEDVYYEGGPHIGDLIFHCVLAITLVFIPLTIGAIIRALWVRYRITSRRISVTGGWMGRNRTDLIYSEVTRVAVIPRGLGLWGDMAVQLKDGSRLEMRAVPQFRELHEKILEHISDKAREASKMRV
ncbi:MAG: PH domain-containing protein [Leptolyngbyaceae cyanobacterium MAG.088]|nr:PH domain-containing protein [Leptolyngbyaceae cyanobacterium MAG.088]